MKLEELSNKLNIKDKKIEKLINEVISTKKELDI